VVIKRVNLLAEQLFSTS